MLGNISLVDISDRLYNYNPNLGWPWSLFATYYYKQPIAIFTSGLDPKERQEQFKIQFKIPGSKDFGTKR